MARAGTRHEQASGAAASRLIDGRIRELNDWRGATLARMRKLILAAAPGVKEEWKWMGTPVWNHGGLICTGETYKQVVKLTFAHGASLPDPKGLFNSSLEGRVRRAIDIRKGETVDARAFTALVKAAVALNASKASAKASAKDGSPKKPARTAGTTTPSKVRLLSGGNPQIAKGDGDAPVQAYIAAMPGWKRAIGERIDAIVGETLPAVQKAVKWNSPFYGVPGRGWFLSTHVFTRFVRVTFFRGTSLKPLPPGESKVAEVRYYDVGEAGLDEARFAKWVKQASRLPGWVP